MILKKKFCTDYLCLWVLEVVWEPVVLQGMNSMNSNLRWLRVGNEGGRSLGVAALPNTP